MPKYYFTFGSAHVQLDGTEMEDYWVTVEDSGYLAARYLFIEKFSSVFMPAPDKWAFQYTEKDFESKWYEKGEYTLIKRETVQP